MPDRDRNGLKTLYFILIFLAFFACEKCWQAKLGLLWRVNNDPVK